VLFNKEADRTFFRIHSSNMYSPDSYNWHKDEP